MVVFSRSLCVIYFALAFLSLPSALRSSEIEEYSAALQSYRLIYLLYKEAKTTCKIALNVAAEVKKSATYPEEEALSKIEPQKMKERKAIILDTLKLAFPNKEGDIHLDRVTQRYRQITQLYVDAIRVCTLIENKQHEIVNSEVPDYEILVRANAGEKYSELMIKYLKGTPYYFWKLFNEPQDKIVVENIGEFKNVIGNFHYWLGNTIIIMTRKSSNENMLTKRPALYEKNK